MTVSELTGIESRMTKNAGEVGTGAAVGSILAPALDLALTSSKNPTNLAMLLFLSALGAGAGAGIGGIQKKWNNDPKFKKSQIRKSKFFWEQ